ncbi:MAG: hypothetical protein WA101_00245 [Minisyncoccia bacterium]
MKTNLKLSIFLIFTLFLFSIQIFSNAQVKNWVPWKTITIGKYKNTEKIKEAIILNGYKISPWANEIIENPAFLLSKKKEEIDLVAVSVSDLGLKFGATYEQVLDTAFKQGLTFCPIEVGPVLCAEYKNQTRGEWLKIATEPVVISDGALSIFMINNSYDGLAFRRYFANPKGFCSIDCKFLFMIKK